MSKKKKVAGKHVKRTWWLRGRCEKKNIFVCKGEQRRHIANIERVEARQRQVQVSRRYVGARREGG